MSVVLKGCNFEPPNCKLVISYLSMMNVQLGKKQT